MKKSIVSIIAIFLLLVPLTACQDSKPTANSSQTTTTTTAPTQTGSSQSPQILSEEEVKTFALFCAGTTEKKVTNYQCKLIYHKERDCQAYEISFDVGRTHFEYVFRATDCDIIVNKKVINKE